MENLNISNKVWFSAILLKLWVKLLIMVILELPPLNLNTLNKNSNYGINNTLVCKSKILSNQLFMLTLMPLLIHMMSQDKISLPLLLIIPLKFNLPIDLTLWLMLLKKTLSWMEIWTYLTLCKLKWLKKSMINNKINSLKEEMLED